jgi:transketolase C-terminal domain/subunit
MAAAVESFDGWLSRQLHQMFDSVAAEPLPVELVALLTGAKVQVG